MTSLAQMTDHAELLGRLREVARAGLARHLIHAFAAAGGEVPVHGADALFRFQLEVSSELIGKLSQLIATDMVRALHGVEARLCSVCGSLLAEHPEDDPRDIHRRCREHSQIELLAHAVGTLGREIIETFEKRCLAVAPDAVITSAHPIALDELVAIYQAMPHSEALHPVLDDGNWDDGSIESAIQHAIEAGDRAGIALAVMLRRLSMAQRMSLAVVCDCGCCPARSSPIPKLAFERRVEQIRPVMDVPPQPPAEVFLRDARPSEGKVPSTSPEKKEP